MWVWLKHYQLQHDFSEKWHTRLLVVDLGDDGEEQAERLEMPDHAAKISREQPEYPECD